MAARCLGSAVRREFINVYDLSPERVGTFDVVVCGTLLLHLRDPFRALAAIRSVCRSAFLSVEQVSVGSGTWFGRTPCLTLQGNIGQWMVPTVAGHRRMLEIAGFDLKDVVGPVVEPYGPAHPPLPPSIQRRLLALRLKGNGVPKSAVLCRPRSL